MALPHVLVVDGPIAAGKSTLVEELKKAYTAGGYKVVTVQEPVELWRTIGMLGMFYEDQPRFCFTFQVLTYTSRINATVEAFKTPADLYILERSVLTDKHIFMNLQKDVVLPAEMEIYNQFFDLYTKLMPTDLSTATYLYLKPSLGVCMERVAQRARAEELLVERKGEKKSGGVDAPYQQRIIAAHDALFEGKASEGHTPPVERPFPLTSVVVADGKHADGNFLPSSADGAAIVASLVEKLAHRIPPRKVSDLLQVPVD